MSAIRRQVTRATIAAGLSGMLAACGSRPAVAPAGPKPPLAAVPIMGAARLTETRLVAWFLGRQPQPPGSFAATVPVDTLAQYYIEEGAAEGVTGDVAFVQAIVETGWFRFKGRVSASANNFAGLGAGESDVGSAAFTDARTGVRAQIQHLRAYADALARTCTTPPLRNPCADPRFDLVRPKGKAPTWNQLGSGNWAASSSYGANILLLFEEAQTFRPLR